MNLISIYSGLVMATVGGIVVVKPRPLRRILGAVIIVAGFLIGSFIVNQPTMASGKQSIQGVPLVANDNLIGVKTLTGHAMILNAAETPVLFFAPQSSSVNLKAVQSVLNAIKEPHRLVILVSTAFHNSAHAARSTKAFLSREHITMPVLIQEGPSTLYVQDTPTLIAMKNGDWVRYHGIADITAHLHALVSIASQPVKHGTSAKNGSKKG